MIVDRASSTTGHRIDSIDANSLNEHYANISADMALPPSKFTANHEWTQDWVKDYRMFKILESLKPTSTGLDGLPAWFLRLGAPVFCKILADLINLSISTSTVPLLQWKPARICPVPKTSGPTQPWLPTNFRHSSSLTYHGEDYCAWLSVSCPQQSAVDAEFRGSVCVSTERLDYCCVNWSPSCTGYKIQY